MTKGETYEMVKEWNEVAAFAAAVEDEEREQEDGVEDGHQALLLWGSQPQWLQHATGERKEQHKIEEWWA